LIGEGCAIQQRSIPIAVDTALGREVRDQPGGFTEAGLLTVRVARVGDDVDGLSTIAESLE
jgi:hypothetical protein